MNGTLWKDRDLLTLFTSIQFSRHLTLHLPFFQCSIAGVMLDLELPEWMTNCLLVIQASQSFDSLAWIWSWRFKAWTVCTRYMGHWFVWFILCQFKVSRNPQYEHIRWLNAWNMTILVIVNNFWVGVMKLHSLNRLLKLKYSFFKNIFSFLYFNWRLR